MKKTPRRVTVALWEDIHKKVKVSAAKRGQKIADRLSELVRVGFTSEGGAE